MFDARPHSVAGQDQRLAQALADVATIGILQRRSAQRGAQVAGQLRHALDSRVVIEQAKGVVAERNSVSMDVAFDALRRDARNHNLKLTDVALAVVRGDLDPGIVTAGPPAAT
jgi:AmiR/NasT family two-component response regulator